MFTNKSWVAALFSGMMFLSLWATANEHAEAPAEKHEEASGGHEAPAEGEGKGESSGHGEAKTTLAPWVEIENKITELSAKVKAKQANIEKLIEEKNHLDNNSPALKAVVKEIVKEHKEMQGLAEEYQKNVTLLKYRFPERNAKAGRSYDRIDVKSVDQMEEALGVDGKLNRNLRKMRTQFGTETKTVGAHEEHKAKTATKAPKKEQSIEEASTIILQK